ncbi:hypothetical protein EDB19DRAFT_1837388 [Suillus lakei]|nr:hypothetical protein EDB19DRAFT_1837388 [Suillus lakei]
MCGRETQYFIRRNEILSSTSRRQNVARLHWNCEQLRSSSQPPPTIAHRSYTHINSNLHSIIPTTEGIKNIHSIDDILLFGGNLDSGQSEDRENYLTESTHHAEFYASAALTSAAEVQFSLVLCQFFQTPNRTTGSGSTVWSNSGPNVTERVREVRFAFEPGLTTKLGSVPSINPYPS